MAHRAKQPFVFRADGARRQFNRDDVVPADIADKVAAYTYDDGTDEPKPRKRAAKKAAAKSDD